MKITQRLATVALAVLAGCFEPQGSSTCSVDRDCNRGSQCVQGRCSGLISGEGADPGPSKDGGGIVDAGADVDSGTNVDAGANADAGTAGNCPSSVTVGLDASLHFTTCPGKPLAGSTPCQYGTNPGVWVEVQVPSGTNLGFALTPGFSVLGFDACGSMPPKFCYGPAMVPPTVRVIAIERQKCYPQGPDAGVATCGFCGEFDLSVWPL